MGGFFLLVFPLYLSTCSLSVHFKRVDYIHMNSFDKIKKIMVTCLALTSNLFYVPHNVGTMSYIFVFMNKKKIVVDLLSNYFSLSNDNFKECCMNLIFLI